MIDLQNLVLLDDSEQHQQGMQFHTLAVDAAKGRVDLVGYQTKITFTAGEKGPAPEGRQ